MHAYLNYLKNVLGIQQVLKDTFKTTVSAPKIAVGVENLESFNEKDKALLQNMLQAMKIPAADMVVFDLKEKAAYSAPLQFDLVMNPDQSGQQTYSPKALHENKNLKSATWTFLQSIMQQYQALP